MSEIIKLKERKPTFDYLLNDLAFLSLKTKILYGNPTNQDRFDFDYQLKLKDKKIEYLEKEKDRLGSLFYERNEENIKLHHIINEARELLNQEWYSVLRKGTISKVKKILDKVEGDKE